MFFFKRILILCVFIGLSNIAMADNIPVCSELDQSGCNQNSTYCEWYMQLDVCIPKCDEYNNNETNCKNLPGCIYTQGTFGTGSVCKTCDENSYCINGELKSCANDAPNSYGAFPYSATGAGSPKSCYASVDSYIDSTGNENNITDNSKKLHIKCKMNDNGGCIYQLNQYSAASQSDSGHYSYKIATVDLNVYFNTIFGNPLYVANGTSGNGVPFPNSNYPYTDDSGNQINPNGYHIEIIPKFNKTESSGSITNNKEGSFYIKLVSNKMKCGQFQKRTCPDNNAEYCIDSTLYIGATDNYCPEEYHITGTAKWVSDDSNISTYNGHWDISDCRCQNSTSPTQDNDKGCFYLSGKTPRELGQTDTSSNNRDYLINIYETVLYDHNNEPGACTACLNGYMPKCNASGITGCNTNQNICMCEPVGKGYYVNDEENEFSNSSNQDVLIKSNLCSSNHAPFREACPASKTTDGPGAGGSETDCHYTGASKFCDTGGCFTLEQLKSRYGIDYETSGHTPTWTDWNE